MLKRKNAIFGCIVILVLSLLLIPGCKKSSFEMVHVAEDKSGDVGFSSGNPAPIKTTVIKTIDMSGQSGSEDMPTEGSMHRIELSVQEIVRGAKAWETMQAASDSNKAPETGFEYLLARVKFGYYSEASSTRWFEYYEYLVKQAPWVAYAADGVTEYRSAANFIPPEPAMKGSMYEGDVKEGWVAFQVPTSDKTPIMTYYYENLWFKLYK